MNFGPKRGHPIFIFENFLKDFGLLVIAIFIGLVKGDMSVITQNIPVLIIVLAGPVGRVVQYLFTDYSIDDEKLIVRSGFLSKKTLEVPISTITTVDFSQRILHQVFGAYRLNIDNASNISEQKTKIKMTFSKQDALMVRSLLVSGRKGIDGLNLAADDGDGRKEEGQAYQVKASELLLMGAIKSKGIFLLQLIGLLSAGSAYFNVTQTVVDSGLGRLFASMSLLQTIMMMIIVVFLLAVICGSAGCLIRYYGFHVLDNGEAIKIEYGLLTKKRYTIQKKKISGFSYDQSLFMRWIGMGTLHLFAIGYGSSGDEESSEEPILFPLIKTAPMRRVIGEILPEMKRESEYEQPQKGSLRYFFYNAGLFFSLMLLLLSVYYSQTIAFCKDLWVVGILLVILSIAGIIMQYKNAAIYGNDENISLSYGGFRKKTVFVKTSNVESVSEQASYFKHKKGITSVTVSYIAPLSEANKKVKNISIEAFENIRAKLIY
ncbi:PH domain-containing protein [Emergencia timonensis]|uniref:PH domain-containing protein n=1 Tax=Emergencia timonensis TaxID=1776384 RepID=UPI003991C65F